MKIRLARAATGFLALTALALGFSISPAAASTAAPAFTCATGRGYIQSLNFVDAQDVSGILKGENSVTYFCANKQTITNAEFEIYGTDLALTWNASKGYFDFITAQNLVSQQLTWNSKSELVSAYNGKCLYLPGVGNRANLNTCNSGNNNDLMTLNNI